MRSVQQKQVICMKERDEQVCSRSSNMDGLCKSRYQGWKYEGWYEEGLRTVYGKREPRMMGHGQERERETDR